MADNRDDVRSKEFPHRAGLAAVRTEGTGVSELIWVLAFIFSEKESFESFTHRSRLLK